MESAFAAIDMPRTLADTAYGALKRDILDFRLAPGDRFTETEIADRLQVSRTPVREALFRLEREGYLEVRQRNGWLVKPLDFNTLDHFYELRSVLETAAVHALCLPAQGPDPLRALQSLADTWLVAPSDRSSDGEWLADLDERFHIDLVAAAGNPEIARVHRAATERIRIVRRLDFTLQDRIDNTYEEHGAILRAVLARDGAAAAQLLQAHIRDSQSAVRKITLHRLYSTRPAKAA
ncbi:GntR family transcriptional regulator [Achromobacter spanius]|uniref:GntR family transcriptional regulator n=1 Tax=Achromobacter spanius TaxID=217203 RepID=A0A2S5GPQ8_9BURK|nr:MULTISPECIES: GntR family transcriptional regulator [Achromobacter]AYD65696.1 GntR family transcriptional regulator [Achromobacter sp. B7]PPA74875.1 GntR family transcriptional regulator [Achromobacter spanius]QYJ19836.1 GntR family transcriptional regulator [Achromobacter sp. ES-001]HCQ46758.1 GntR family transcriptional regulator [Achromobacter sp.]